MVVTLVDTSVWIDYLDGHASAEADLLDDLLGQHTLVMGDLVLVEVLQGIRFDSRFEAARSRLELLPLVTISDRKIAIEAARNYRLLRTKGITIRKTIDTLIATRCIVEGWSLLHRDRDYEPFITHLGLRPALRLS